MKKYQYKIVSRAVRIAAHDLPRPASVSRYTLTAFSDNDNATDIIAVADARLLSAAIYAIADRKDDVRSLKLRRKLTRHA